MKLLKLKSKLAIVVDRKLLAFLDGAVELTFYNINEVQISLDSLYNEMLRRYEYMAAQGEAAHEKRTKTRCA